MVSLYAPDAFEISIGVNFDTVFQLVFGTQATIRLADLPDVTLAAVVSELGSRADAVSSFPVVLRLKENPSYSPRHGCDRCADLSEYSQA